MQNFIAVMAILAMIGVGVLLINLLNGQHDARIAAFRYGKYRRFVPGAHSRSGLPTVTPEPRSGRRRTGGRYDGWRAERHAHRLARRQGGRT